ncbi:MAG: hypothetical protein CMM32_00860 [Rhodospirillaceae bacterium]|nr:hypothetical protein [Rhodospirillaceae bacterium]
MVACSLDTALNGVDCSIHDVVLAILPDQALSNWQENVWLMFVLEQSRRTGATGNMWELDK